MSGMVKKFVKKIDSPYAKYNEAGQLFCVVCNAQVKNEMYWIGHMNGKGHREQVLLLKKKVQGPVTKRPAPPPEPPPKNTPSDVGVGLLNGEEQNKRLKLADDVGVMKISPMGPPPLVSILKKGSVATGAAASPSPRPSPNKPDPAAKSAPSLPHTSIPKRKTFKEIEDEMMEVVDVGPIVRKDQVVEEKEVNIVPAVEAEDKLPQGFFDDAKEDAKARGLEYRNPEEAEWEKFVKEIATEEVRSTALMAAEDEDIAKDRELDEIEEQMKHLQRVIDLEKKAQEVRASLGVSPSSSSITLSTQDKQNIIVDGMEGVEEKEESEEDEFQDEDLDWRIKRY